MFIIKSIIAGATAVFRSIFVPKADKSSMVIPNYCSNPETERYIELYRANRSTPYFGESDEESEDGLILR